MERTREEAIKWCQQQIEMAKPYLSNSYLEEPTNADYETQALEACLAALRGPEWVRTADRLPEGDEHDYVLTVWRGWRGNYAWSVEPTQIGAVRLLPELYYYWMPLPKLPEVEG